MIPKKTSPEELEWIRISSYKPYFAALVATILIPTGLLYLVPSAHHLMPVILAGTIVALGLIILSSKVVHRRGGEYRISTLFHSELIRRDEICLAVNNPGRFWVHSRIHLKRPARCGWAVSYVPLPELDNERMPR